MADLGKQLQNFRLTTAQIFYRMPDYGSILQEYIWQDYDLAPQFPKLNEFVAFWTEELEGPIHSIYVANTKLIKSETVFVADWQGELGAH